MKRFILAIATAAMCAVGVAAQQNQGYPTPLQNYSGKYGYANATGQMVIRPRYDNALPFKEGFAAVEQGGKWGFIDRAGHTLGKIQYQLVRNFNLGYALVKMKGKWGAINTDGELVVPCQYEKETELGDVKRYMSLPNAKQPGAEEGE